MALSWEMDKQTVGHPYNRIVLVIKKKKKRKQIIDTYNIDESEMYISKWNEWEWKGYIPYDSIYMTF